MSRLNKTRWIILFCSLCLAGSLMSQDINCLLISEELPHANDVILQNWLEAQYYIELATGDDINGHFYTVDDFKQFDFIFVSESISSSDTRDLKGAPVPIFYTELWSSKWDVAGWVPTNTSGTYYENSPEQLVTIINGDHPLAAGFPTGTEIMLASGTNDPNGAILTYSVPQVDHIPVAVMSADPTRVVVMGVEKGTVLYNAENVADGSMVSESRCAAVGINATANDFITDEGFQLIQAGIQWILEEETGIEEESAPLPTGIKLAQNFPNPFNPETTISYELNKADHVRLTVYDNLGREVTTLVNEEQMPGSYQVKFGGQHYTAGLYLCILSAGFEVRTLKMMLIK
jgi:hypothetical protein